jgi:hypothetical protein
MRTVLQDTGEFRVFYLKSIGDNIGARRLQVWLNIQKDRKRQRDIAAGKLKGHAKAGRPKKNPQPK